MNMLTKGKDFISFALSSHLNPAGQSGKRLYCLVSHNSTPDWIDMTVCCLRSHPILHSRRKAFRIERSRPSAQFSVAFLIDSPVGCPGQRSPEERGEPGHTENPVSYLPDASFWSSFIHSQSTLSAMSLSSFLWHSQPEVRGCATDFVERWPVVSGEMFGPKQ